jgi:hypothetical protein
VRIQGGAVALVTDWLAAFGLLANATNGARSQPRCISPPLVGGATGGVCARQRARDSDHQVEANRRETVSDPENAPPRCKPGRRCLGGREGSPPLPAGRRTSRWPGRRSTDGAVDGANTPAAGGSIVVAIADLSAPWPSGRRTAAGRAASLDRRPRPRGCLASPRHGGRDCGARSRPACVAGFRR